MQCDPQRRTAAQSVLTIILITVGAAAHTQAAPVTLWNEVTGDGSLTVTVDDYGSFADTFGGGPQMLDLFNPSPDPLEGELFEEFATFATEVFLFIDPSGVGNGTHRAVLSTHAGILSTYPNGNANCEIVQENSTDNLPTSTDSEFRCEGGGSNLTFTLTQTVSSAPGGPNDVATASLEQTYAVTSESLSVVEFILVKHIDADMPWGGGSGFYLDDTVGVDFAELGRPQVYAVDRNLNTAAMTLRTREDMWLDPRTVDFVYYPGKQNLPPPPGNPNYPDASCPAHDYGTDIQIWDSYGVPNCWKNYVPQVGYDVPGQSPVDAEGDSFMGLQLDARVTGGEAPYELTFVTQYGHGPLVAPPQIMHERGRPGQTRPHSGYMDPRTEVGFPPQPPEPMGLTETVIKFSDRVFACDGSDVGVGNFFLSETGDGNPPVIVSVEDANPPHQVHWRVEWDRPITLQEWTTLRTHVCNAEFFPIQPQGDLGPGVNEPDRVDVAFLPAGISQSGHVDPFDLLLLRQLLNDFAVPAYGTLEDLVDTDRSGVITPFDLLRFRQLINGIPPATRSWAGESLNHPRP